MLALRKKKPEMTHVEEDKNYTYFSRTAWTSIPGEFHLQVGANESKTHRTSHEHHIILNLEYGSLVHFLVCTSHTV